MSHPNDDYRPRHALPPCGIAWCTDPNCGAADDHQVADEGFFTGTWVEQAVQEFGAARRARIESTPRRVATRFGVLAIAAVVYSWGGVASQAAANTVESLAALPG